MFKNSASSKGFDPALTIFIPLYSIGLCEAVTSIPASAEKCTVAKYTSSFTPPSSQYDFATDPNQSYVMFAATFAGTNGDTNITYNTTTNQTTVPSSALTAVGDTNYKKLSFFSNFDKYSLCFIQFPAFPYRNPPGSR